MSIEGDRVRVGIRVDVPVDRAFELFTAHIDQWWRRGSKYRVSGRHRGVLRIEPHVGGRLFETWQGPTGAAQVVATGEVLRWEPPALLQLRWRNVNFRGDEATTLTVRFEAQGASTWVSVTHEGFAALRPDHPARHGHQGAAFVRMMGMWWGELLRSLHERALGEG